MKKQFRSFEDARKFVHLLNLKNKKEWEKYYESGMISDDIPSNPNRNYNEEWRVGGDLLGTGFEAIKTGKYRRFEDTRKYVHSIKIEYPSIRHEKVTNPHYNAKCDLLEINLSVMWN